MTAFPIVQTIYWIALAAWFGGGLMIAIIGPVIFKAIEEADPTLPRVLAVNLERQHSALLASDIMGRIIHAFSSVQLGCAGALLVSLVAQWFIIDLSQTNIIHGIVRSCLFVAAVALGAYQRWVIWPKAEAFKKQYIDNADDPEIADPARERFDRAHQENIRILFAIIVLLSCMVAFSSRLIPE